jgi:hypothetical protein
MDTVVPGKAPLELSRPFAPPHTLAAPTLYSNNQNLLLNYALIPREQSCLQNNFTFLFIRLDAGWPSNMCFYRVKLCRHLRLFQNLKSIPLQFVYTRY